MTIVTSAMTPVMLALNRISNQLNQQPTAFIRQPVYPFQPFYQAARQSPPYEQTGFEPLYPRHQSLYEQTGFTEPAVYSNAFHARHEMAHRRPTDAMMINENLDDQAALEQLATWRDQVRRNGQADQEYRLLGSFSPSSLANRTATWWSALPNYSLQVTSRTLVVPSLAVVTATVSGAVPSAADVESA